MAAPALWLSVTEGELETRRNGLRSRRELAPKSSAKHPPWEICCPWYSTMSATPGFLWLIMGNASAHDAQYAAAARLVADLGHPILIGNVASLCAKSRPRPGLEFCCRALVRNRWRGLVVGG